MCLGWDAASLERPVGDLDSADLVGVTAAVSVRRDNKLGWAFKLGGVVRHLG